MTSEGEQAGKKAEQRPGAKPKDASAAAPAAAPDTAPKKNKKIGKMAYEEIEKKLEEVKSKMRSLDSRYAKELLARKSALLKEKSAEAAGKKPENNAPGV